ncbi:hypothetical protein ES706_00052 [subsurface metagenome]
MNRLLKDIQARVGKIKGKRKTIAVAFFDLSGSTPMKLEKGHTPATRTMLFHNLICREIATKYNGSFVKELGDGVLITFDDPVSACRAAVDIKTASHRTGKFVTKAGLTFGAVEEIRTGSIKDILGTTVDRCARIQSLALPDQILIDSSLRDAASSFLQDDSNIRVGPSNKVLLRGIGPTVLYELSPKETRFAPFIAAPIIFYEEGRLSIDEKVAFMQTAKREVIELGIGLRTFTKYFTNRKPAEFKDHVVGLMQQGVTFRCMLLDPDAKAANQYARDLNSKDYIKDIRRSIGELKKLQKEFRSLNLKGVFEIYLYEHFPYFHAVCVDPETKAGHITVSHYLYGLSRADAPVFQFYKAMNKEMFVKYWHSIKGLLEESKLI